MPPLPPDRRVSSAPVLGLYLQAGKLICSRLLGRVLVSIVFRLNERPII